MWRPAYYALDHLPNPRWHVSSGTLGRMRVLGVFGVEQRLRQGYVIAPLLFIMFFTAVLHIGLAKFNNDSDILQDMARARKREKG